MHTYTETYAEVLWKVEKIQIFPLIKEHKVNKQKTTYIALTACTHTATHTSLKQCCVAVCVWVVARNGAAPR